ncbi:glycosyltransferase family 1 protein [Sinorhizobium meliloti]|nr:glycosyltransferase family 1 protein [Sinorhizobium meliloti]
MFRLSMPALGIETRKVLFDISRLLRSRNRRFATGIDRIDLAIGLDLAERFGTNCHFVHAGSLGTSLLPMTIGKAILDFLDARWNRQETADLSRATEARLVVELVLGSVTLRKNRSCIGPDTTYVVASHSGLGKRPGSMERLDPRKRMRRIVYLHDIIPLEFPEYQRPATRAEFSAYLDEMFDTAVKIVCNSDDTANRVRVLAERQQWSVEDVTVVKPELVANPVPAIEPRSEVLKFLCDERPFFTIVGTIEPRKNHLLLLNLWREFVSAGEAPRLCIIGKRGWENASVLNMLDRCESIKECITEFGDLADYEVQLLMKASEALLFPSFAEGLGIPILEAAALGVNCIASDIAAFRETAPPGTIFLHPLDGLGWKREIYSRLSRDAQHVRAM